MSVGVWMVPVVLVTLVVILFASAWLEGFVAPMGDEFDPAAPEALDSARLGIAAPPVELFIEVDPGPEVRSPAA